MIFSAIVKIIKAAVDGFANLCAFLLIKLGLWLPALFCLIYLLACAVMGIKLEGVAFGLFIGGTVICLMLGVFLVLKLHGRAKEKVSRTKSSYSSVPRSMQSSVLDYPETRGANGTREIVTSTFEYSGRADENNNLAAEPEVAVVQNPPPDTQKRSGTTYEKLKERPYKYDDFSDLRQKYFKNKDGQEAPQTNRMAEIDRSDRAESNNNFVPEVPLPPVVHYEKPTPVRPREEPMIFATRRDPNVLVYEYSDRLEFYKKTRNGLELIQSVNKR